MSEITNISKWEQAIVMFLNFEGWDLEWSGGMEHYDAFGKTSKGIDCVIEMKFRNKYYDSKMLECYKYEKLMSLGVCVIYFVADPKGTYMFWLNDLEMPEREIMRCPKTSFWNDKKTKKCVYFLPENTAHRIKKNER